MEEQRARQEQEVRRGQSSSAGAETSTIRPETINESKSTYQKLIFIDYKNKLKNVSLIFYLISK